MKKIRFLLLVLLFAIFVFAIPCFATEEPGDNDEIVFSIDTESDLDSFEKTMYVYAKETLDNGEIVAGLTDDINDIPTTRGVPAPNVTIMLYYERLSPLYYKIEAVISEQVYLIYSFNIDLSFGDGYTSGTIIGQNNPPYVGNFSSFSSTATAYHVYQSPGTYTVHIKSSTIRIADPVNPNTPGPAIAYDNPMDIPAN